MPLIILLICAGVNNGSQREGAVHGNTGHDGRDFR